MISTRDLPGGAVLGPERRVVAELWAEVVRWTREVCLLRAEGRREEAATVWRTRVGEAARRWSARCGRPSAEVEERLRGLFAEMQDLVARGLVRRRLARPELIARGRGVVGHEAAWPPIWRESG
jgi:hypothetical protein